MSNLPVLETESLDTKRKISCHRIAVTPIEAGYIDSAAAQLQDIL